MSDLPAGATTVADTTQYPYRAIVLVVARQGNAIIQGSGVLIAPDEVLTASHLLYNVNAGESINVVVYPAYNTTVGVYGSSAAANLHFNVVEDGNGFLSAADSRIDDAVIHLATPFTGLGTMSLLADDPGGIATVGGYPATADGAQVTLTSPVGEDPSLGLITGEALGPGSSGGPLYVDQGYGPQVIGTVSAGASGTTRYATITDTTLAQIELWVAADDGPAAASLLTMPSAFGVAHDIDALEQLAQTGQAAPFGLRDPGVGTLPITLAQLDADQAALRFITSPFTIDLGATGARGQVAATQAIGLGATTVARAVQFADGRVVFDPNDPAAETVRLYLAAFGRAPDQPGMAYWAGQLASGTSATTVAAGFVGSAEFAVRYGLGTGVTAFVNQLYANVLGRGPDPAGYTYWAGLLAGGASQATVLAGFAGSTEDQTDTAATVRQGIWDLDAAAPSVARLYDAAFGRAPDAAGLRSWDTAIDTGSLTLAQVAQAFVGSPEYAARYGTPSDATYVAELYANTLHRAPSAADLAYWTPPLDSGAITRAGALVGFSESAEHQALTAANIYGADPSTYGAALG